MSHADSQQRPWNPKWTGPARRALLKNGFEPIPLNGKIPVISEWQNLRPTLDDIVSWETTNAGRNTGILTRLTPAVDDDVLDQKVADIVHGWVKELIPPGCPELLRIGKAPKRAILFRCDIPFSKVSTGEWIDKSGTKHQLEILCDGQQLAVYGDHPDTHLAYAWAGVSPGRIQHSALPVLTPEAARSLVERAIVLFRERGWRPKHEERQKEPPRRASGFERSDSLAHKIATGLAVRIEALCREILPNGKIKGKNWVVGSVNGESGESMRVCLLGESRGLWLDFADAGWKGDALDLVEAVKNLKPAEAMDWALSWLGWPPREPPRKTRGDGGVGGGAHQDRERHGTQPTRSAVLVKADTIKPQSISWAWKGRLAFGKLAMVAGDPGLGKSTILIEIAALHSIGGEFPCGEGRAQQCEVVILTAEDGLGDTVIPRLIAAGADLSKIHFLTGTKAEGEDGEALFNLATDIAALRAVLEANPGIRILIIDPLTAYLGATKAKENAEVRRTLAPLVS
jgi:hypothetical protein